MRALSHRIVFFLRLASAHSDVDGASERDTDSSIPRPNPRVRSGIPLTWALTVSHDCATHAPSKRKTRAAARHVRVKSLKTYMCMTSTPKSYGIRREEREAVINLPEVARRRFTSLLADVRDGDAGVRVRGEPEARHFVARPRVGDTATLEETVDSRADTAIAGVPTEMTLSSALG